jgi:hypothetical protein
VSIDCHNCVAHQGRKKQAYTTIIKKEILQLD